MEAFHWLYSISGIILVLFYLPQMIAVTKANSSLVDISLMSWAVWSVCTLSSALYGIYVLDDLKLTLISMASGTCCLYVTLVTFSKRRRFKSPVSETPKTLRFRL